MDRMLPYLLIVILLIGGWNESFKSRFDRLTGRSEEQQATEETSAAAPAQTPFIAPSQSPRATARYTPTPVPTPAPSSAQGAPFFNDPSYRNALDRSSTKKH